MDWKIEQGFLTKNFEFEDFISGVDFVNQIIPIVENLNHHPDILIHSYKKVKIKSKTHSNNKITKKDYELANKIDQLVEIA
jgi:4a-hydroxytetrahydrobiopterin dehydratase